jgi:hypothetical protein
LRHIVNKEFSYLQANLFQQQKYFQRSKNLPQILFQTFSNPYRTKWFKISTQGNFHFPFHNSPFNTSNGMRKNYEKKHDLMKKLSLMLGAEG